VQAVRVVQYDEKGSRKYYEATCVKVEQSEGGTWAVPSSSFVSGSVVLKDQLLVGYALMDLSEPNAPVLFSDVDEMISAHNSRGLAVQKGPVGLGGSNKRQKGVKLTGVNRTPRRSRSCSCGSRSTPIEV